MFHFKIVKCVINYYLLLLMLSLAFFFSSNAFCLSSNIFFFFSSSAFFLSSRSANFFCLFSSRRHMAIPNGHTAIPSSHTIIPGGHTACTAPMRLPYNFPGLHETCIWLKIQVKRILFIVDNFLPTFMTSQE